MDHFGIGQAVAGVVGAYFQASRRTGRTTSLVESVKDGDRIFFADSREAERVRRLCMDRGVKVECIVINPKQAERVFERGTSQGRSLFDHSWIEKYYLAAIELAQTDLDHLERETSGYGTAHRKTRKLAEEMAKFQIYPINKDRYD